MCWLEAESDKPLDFEIGSGQGLFAIQRSLARQDRRLLAVERTTGKFQALLGRFARHGSPANLLPVHSDAVNVLTHAISPNQIENCFLLYPNPYPKAKHANLRWGFSSALQLLESRIGHMGRLILATNLEWYANEARENIPLSTSFRLDRVRELDAREPGRTHFERKYLSRGERLFEITFVNWKPEGK